MNPLDRFHASWPRGVAPSIVEHFADAADHVAPAMTLWSGAERVGSMLAAARLERGDRLSCALAPGARWAQTLLGALMRGVVFCPVVPGAAPSPDTRAHVDALGALTLSSNHPRALDGPAAVIFSDGRLWSLDALDSLASGDVPLPRSGARMCSEAPWWEPTGVATLWLALTAGAELHVGATGDELHRLGPDVLTARPGRLTQVLEWAPIAPKGVAVIGGAPTLDDERVAAQRGWPLLSFALPG
ncbi:MAG: hypothetical protein Q8L14_24035 [Myxococcales bacterium]|nr:hypothetical protein [Myxococcales bacterium]